MSLLLAQKMVQKSLVTLENEILMVQTYVGIENIRFDSLSFNICKV